MKKDGHIHTPYCPHGTNDSFHMYIEKAIKRGFQAITFTEHAPLPIGFIDPTPDKDSGMSIDQLESYISELEKLKKEYNKDIVISTGLEVDFITGFEQITTSFLNTYGKYLDDSILSVHFLKYENDYTCIDFSKTTFLEFVDRLGNPMSVYKLYYKTLTDSITSNLGNFKPKRIGHITLVHKFQHAFTEEVHDHEDIVAILNEIKHQQLELDVNSAGLAKPYCLESYPPPSYIKLAKELEIPLVFGSDAHQAKDLHQSYNEISTLL
ncbi:histidinol-phosphatase (PHP family) [Psychrobacillus sp. OK028]|uniref:histidinol-phosphatase HisJ n=1 Tax=Psychrobacillus sp. OK028 TaxID=1884359 RepID=UPI0008814433|nr:histidinol-phosphatase HisJ [Psychrobacillus sp. OK028]SDM73151.1 histidinol-phosphatase (PHP family) [Psychrobacillus sp. OK028]